MLGVKVIPTVATKKKGLDELLKAVIESADKPSLSYGAVDGIRHTYCYGTKYL